MLSSFISVSSLKGFHFTACLVTGHDVCDPSGLLHTKNSLLFFNMYNRFELSFIGNCFFFLLNTGPIPEGPTISDTEVSVRIFSNVNLTCLIDWNPDNPYCPEYQLWSLPRNGTKYNQSLEDTGSKCKKELVLSIFNVTENDEGTYRCDFFCKDRNTTKATIDLKVFAQPTTGIVRKLYGQM